MSGSSAGCDVTETSRLFFDMEPGDRIDAGQVCIEVIRKSGRSTRLMVTAPRTENVAAVIAKQNHRDDAMGVAVCEPSIAR